MQDIIKKIGDSVEGIHVDALPVGALYDKYAPALYGRILQVVKQKDIAEKILERVFINVFLDKNVKQANHLSLFTSLLNHSRKKSYGTIKAIRLMEALRCGSETSMAGSSIP